MPYFPNHTGEVARKDLYGDSAANPGYLCRLLALTYGDPTTAELEEALALSMLVTGRIRVWVSGRHIIEGHTTMTGPKAEALAAALNTAEDAALDEMAARDANVMPCHGVDPFFAPALNTVWPNREAV